MMRRMTINIDTGIDDNEALAAVAEVVRGGRISGYGTTYCYATRFRRTGIVVGASRTRTGNDSFVVLLERGE